MIIRQRRQKKNPPEDQPLSKGNAAQLLVGIARVIKDSTQLDDVYRQVTALTEEVSSADRVNIALLDLLTDEIHQDYVDGVVSPPPCTAPERHRQHGILEEVHRTGETLRIDDMRDVAQRLPGIRGLVVQGFRSGIYVPIIKDDRVIGVIGTDRREKDAFTEADLDLLIHIAEQLVEPVVSTISRRKMDREDRERELIAEISSAGNSSLDIKDALDRVFEKIQKIIPADRMSVSVTSTNTRTLDYAYVAGTQVQLVSGVIGARDGLRAIVARTGKSRIVNFIDDDLLAEAPGLQRLLDSGLHSSMFVPVGMAGKTFGVLALQSTRSHAYSSHDLELIETTASQLTGAVAHARLSAAADQQSHQQKILTEIGHSIDAATDLAIGYESLASLAAELIPYDRFAVVILDDVDESQTYREHFVRGEQLPGYEPGKPIAFDGSITGHVVDTGDTVVWPSEEWPDDRLDKFPMIVAARESGLRSFISVPLNVADKCVGVLHFDGLSRWMPDEGDKALAKLISLQVSGPLSRLHLRDRIERTAREEEMLAEISRIITSSVDFGEVFYAIVTSISSLIQFDRMAIASIDTESAVDKTLYVWGTAMRHFAPGDSRDILPALLTSSWPGDEGRYYESQDHEKFGDKADETAAIDVGLKSVMAVYIHARGSVIGNLSVRSADTGIYSDRDLDLLRKVAAQLSGPFANSELYAKADRLALEESTLARIGRSVGSMFDPETALERILEDLRILVPADLAGLTLLNEFDGSPQDLFLSGIDEEGEDRTRRMVPAPHGVSQRVITTGDTVVVKDASAGSDGILGVRHLVGAGIRSSVSVPLFWDDKIIGVFGVMATEGNAYEPRHVEVVRRIGVQLAGWVINARLHSNLERQARINAVMADIGRDAGSSLDLAEGFQNLINRLNLLISADRVTVAVRDVERSGLRTVFSIGLETNIGVTAKGYSPSADGIPAHVFKTGEPIFANNLADWVEEYPDVQIRLDAGIQSTVVVPLLWDSEIVGILGVGSTKVGAYSKSDPLILERAAQHLAGAVVNAELHARVERQARDQALLAEIGRAVNSSINPDETFASLTKLVKELVPAQRVVITSWDNEMQSVAHTVSADAPGVTGRMNGDTVPFHGSFTEYVLNKKKILLWSRGDTERESFPGLAPFIEAGLSSTVAVPLFAVDRPVGVLHISNFDGELLTDRDIEMAEAVAAQIAGAVANADLFVMAANEARQRTILAEIGSLFSSSLTIEGLWENLSGPFMKLIPYDRLALNMYDEERDEWYLRDWSGVELKTLKPIVGPTSASLRMRQERATVVISDNAATSDKSAFPVFSEAGLRSTMLTPLIVNDNVIGLIGAHAKAPSAFTEQHVYLSEQISRLIAGAVQNAELHEGALQEARERSTLAEIGRLFGSSLDIDEMCRTLAEPFAELVPYDRFVISTFDIQRAEWQIRHVHGIEAPDRPSVDDQKPYLRRSTTATLQVLNTRSPVVISDHDDPDEAFRFENYPDAGLRSSLLVPLVAMDQVIGLIVVHSRKPNEYTERQIDLGEQVARQITGALNNAALHEQTLRDAEERSVLAEIGRLAGSSLDAEELFGLLTPALKSLITFDRLAISTYNESNNSWITSYTHGKPLPDAEPGDVQGSVTPASRYVLESKSSILMRDPSDEDGLFHDPRAKVAGFNSLALAPMLESGDVVGAIGIHAREPGAYTEHHVELLERVAAQISGAFVNSALHARVEQQARDQALLAEIGRAITSSVDPDDVFERVSSLVRKLIPADSISFSNPGLDSPSLAIRVSTDGPDIPGALIPGDSPGGSPGNPVGGKFSYDGSLTQHVMETRAPYLWPIPGKVEDLAKRFPLMAPYVESGLSSAMAVPVLALGRPVGVLHINNFNGTAHSERDFKMAQAVGDQIAGALANAEMFAQSEREARERTLLAEIGRLVGSTLNLNEVHAGVAELIRDLLPFDRMSLVSVNVGSETVSSSQAVGPMPGDWLPGMTGSIKGSILEHLTEIKTGLLIRGESSGEIVRKYPAIEPLTEVMDVRCMIAVPFIHEGEVTGVLNLTSESPDAYSNSDLELAERIALQMTGAFVNSGLHTQVEQQASDQALLAEIGRIVNLSSNIEPGFDRLAQLVRQLTSCQRVTVLGWEPESEMISVLHASGPVGALTRSAGDEIPMAGTIAEQVIRNGKTVVWPVPGNIDEPAPRNPGLKAYLEIGMSSLIASPLKVHDRPIGALFLYSFDGTHFSEHDIEMSGAVADQIAGAVANADLFAQTQREARERTVLAEIGRLIGSTLDLEGIYAGVADQIALLLPNDRMSLVTIDIERHVLISAHVSGPHVANWELGETQPLAGTIAEAVIRSKSGLLVRAESDADFVSQYPGQEPISLVMDVRSLVAVPLMRRGEVFGVMHITSETPDMYSDVDLRLAERIGDHIAGGVVNADLFAQTEREARERTVVAEIGRMIGSTLDLSEIHAGMAELIRGLLPFDRMSLVRVNIDSDTLTSLHSVGPQAPEWSAGSTNTIKGTTAEKMMIDGSGLLINSDSSADLVKRFPGHQPLAEIMEIRSVMAVPLMHRRQLTGVLHLTSETPEAYSQADLELAERIASQMAGAVVNADLFARTEEQSRERELLAQVGRIVGSTLDLSEMWPRVLVPIKKLLSYDRLAVVLIDSDTGKRWTEFTDGFQLKGKERGDEQPDKTPTALMMRSGSPIFIDDVENSAGFAGMMGEIVTRAGFRSKVGVPIIFNAEMVGEIDIKSLEPNAFTDQDVERLDRIAGIIAGAIANSRLHLTVTTRAEEEQVISNIGRLVGVSLDFGSTFDELADEVHRLVPYDRFVVMGADVDEHLIWTHFVAGDEIPGWGPGSFRVDEWTEDHYPLPLEGLKETSPGGDLATVAGLPELMLVPLVWEGKTIGYVATRSREPGTFTDHHLDLLGRVAQQITGPFVNAELHAITTQEADERASLIEISRLVSSSLAIDEMVGAIAEPLKKLIPYDRFTITTRDATSDTWTTRYVIGVHVPGYEPGTEHPDVEPPAITNNTEVSPDSSLQDEMKEAGLSSALICNLIVNGIVVGSISARSFKTDVYTHRHVVLGRRIADQISGSVANAELHAITIRDAAERTGLAEISRLASSSLDVEEMFEAISEPLKLLVPYDRFAYSTYDSQGSVWTIRFVKGDAIENYETGVQHPDTSPFGSSLISYMDTDVEFGSEDSPDFPEAIAAGLPALIVAPLIVSGERIGVLSVRSRTANIYTQKHADLTRRIADQIAGSVVNSELHRELADIEARTRAVVETAAVGIVTADEQLTIQTVNDAVLTMFGYTRDELIGKNVMELAAEPYRSEHPGYIDRYNRTDEPRIIGTYREVDGLREDGTVFPIELEVTRVDLERGRMYTGVIRDITDRKVAEAEIKEMSTSLEQRVQDRTAQLLQANTELEAFSYTVSHDLRGPLTMNVHLARRLLESDDDVLSDTSRKYIELIARSSTESAELVTDLLNFARLGHQKMNVESVNPSVIVNSVQSECAEIYPEVRWTLNQLPHCDADPGLLRAVYTNLLSNACKFTASKSDPEVEVGSMGTSEEVVFYVRDNGVGFDMEQEHRVFEVFERLHRPEDYAGTGAGLAIVRRIVERHGGKIWVDSEIDVGTTFFFTLAGTER